MRNKSSEIGHTRKRKNRKSLSFNFGTLVILAFVLFVGIFVFNIFISHNGLIVLQRSSIQQSNDKEIDTKLVQKIEQKEMELVELKSQAAALKVDLSRSHAALRKQIDEMTEQIRKLQEKPIVNNREEPKPKIEPHQPIPQEKSQNNPALEMSEHEESQNHKQDAQRKDSPKAINDIKSNLPADHVHDSSSGAACLGSDTTLLVICHDRADYLQRTLDAVLRYHPGGARVPIVISQDGSNPKVIETINNMKQSFLSKHPEMKFFHVKHPQEGNLRKENGYVKLSQHFKWAFDQVFSVLTPEANRIIVLEEDLEVAPDFFELFGALHHLLDTDPTVLAVSAWNDNGQADHVQDPKALYRSDFFPGLGWMTTRAIWEELKPKWPKGYWDDWLREPEQRKGRYTLRPEVCRTFHFGVKGTSNMQYGSYLTNIKLNDNFVPFGQMDLSYLEETRWQTEYLGRVKSAIGVTVQQVQNNEFKRGHEPVRVTYNGIQDFAKKARHLGVMDNEKAGVPRTAYKNIVDFWRNGVKVFLAPQI